MRSNPVEIKHFELLQTLPTNSRDAYRTLADVHGMCPWLAAACVNAEYPEAAGRTRGRLLAYVNADHCEVAKERRDALLRQRLLEGATVPIYGRDLVGGRVTLGRGRLPRKEDLRFATCESVFPWKELHGPAFLSRLFHWRTL